MEIQQATPSDATQIANLKDLVWPEDKVDLKHIVRMLEDPSHVTLVSTEGKIVVGFVDGFTTSASHGILRWEIDLIAVRPDYHGHGLGKQLVAASTEVTHHLGAALARGLTQIDNVRMQHVFRSVGYIPSQKLALWIAPANDVQDTTTSLTEAHLIPVLILNYQGLWIEGQITRGALKEARAQVTCNGWDIAAISLYKQCDLVECQCDGDGVYMQLDLTNPSLVSGCTHAI